MKSRINMNSAITFVLALFLYCVPAIAGSTLAPFDPAQAPVAPDYAKAAGWVALPENPNSHPVDIFWVYPTILMDQEHWLMDKTSPVLSKLAGNTLIKQASVFKGQANLYAPYYRQMNMAGLTLPAEDMDKLIKYGMDDVWRAFTYYLKHYNQGRPFFLAGHSQGSDLLTELVVKHWGSLGVEKQLVAAYLIGWSITPEDLKRNPALTMCESATQTNCFMGYNTVAAGRQKVAPTLKPGGIVVNPLTWRTDGKFAPATLNLGSRFFDKDMKSTVIPEYTSAQVVDSGLVVVPSDPAMVSDSPPNFPKGVYHVYDYSLFYENIRQNVSDRIKAFQAQ